LLVPADGPRRTTLDLDPDDLPAAESVADDWQLPRGGGGCSEDGIGRASFYKGCCWKDSLADSAPEPHSGRRVARDAEILAVSALTAFYTLSEYHIFSAIPRFPLQALQESSATVSTSAATTALPSSAKLAVRTRSSPVVSDDLSQRAGVQRWEYAGGTASPSTIARGASSRHQPDWPLVLATSDAVGCQLLATALLPPAETCPCCAGWQT
jgi:hypothetical protein